MAAKKLIGLKGLGKPPKAGNPSLISQKSKQRKPITLARPFGDRGIQTEDTPPPLSPVATDLSEGDPDD